MRLGRGSEPKDHVELTLYYHGESASGRAIAVSDNGERIWLPKSQIEYTVADGGAEVTLQCPEWLAKEKGLI